MSDDERFAPTTKDGFRPRRKRPKGWMKQAIKDGVIADPNNPPSEPVYGDNVQVISVPVGSIDAVGPKE